MSLERLVAEVRHRSQDDLTKERARIAEESRVLLEQRDRDLKQIVDESERLLALEVARVRTSRVARAKVEGRKLVFEARERAAERSLSDTRAILAKFTGSEEYSALLEQMYDYAVARLGKPVRVSGRAEDASVLKSLVGKSLSPKPVAIAGGMIVETGDGSRRLDLSFDELLRRREDEILELARGPGSKG